MPSSKHLSKWLVEVSKPAELDFDEVIDYVISIGEFDLADKIITEFEETKLSLATLPDRGHYPEELQRIGVFSHKEIHFGVYRVVFHIDEALGWVFVDAILDGRRDVEKILKDRVFRVPKITDE